jgi:hypothetical protein
MALYLDVPSPLQYFASLVQSDEHFPLLEAAISVARTNTPTWTWSRFWAMWTSCWPA